MTDKAGKRSLLGARLLSLCGWTFIVASGVYEVVIHHGRIAGFHGFSTWLGIIVGAMCVFNELKGLLEEPR